MKVTAHIAVEPNGSYINFVSNLRFMFCLLKANCQYNQLISNGDLYHRVTTENKENLPAIIAGKANHPTTMIAAFNKHPAIFAGDDRRRQTVALHSQQFRDNRLQMEHIISLSSEAPLYYSPIARKTRGN